jgi:sirohydrochlorin cobaltochelatase
MRELVEGDGAGVEAGSGVGRPTLAVLVHEGFPPELMIDVEEVCRSFSGYIGVPVALASSDGARLEATLDWLTGGPGGWEVRLVAPATAKAASMSSAPFVYREDGRPDWSAMWQGFCELALYGGPPHRGESDALQAVEGAPVAPAEPDFDAIAEIRRGIYETTGLFSEPSGEPGWLAVTCHSRRMAAWMAASIILENVDARSDEERLLVPAHPSFRLKNEVKSVITVVAKCNHYWQAHLAGVAAAE